MTMHRWILAVATLGFLVTGCQPLPLGRQSDPVDSATAQALTEPGAAAPSATPAPPSSYFVEVHSDWFGTKGMTKPYREGMTVQDALEQSGALSTMRAVEIDLVRQEGNRFVRMPCDYNVSKRHVDYAQDYALRPSDRVMIRPKKTNFMDATLRALGGTMPR